MKCHKQQLFKKNKCPCEHLYIFRWPIRIGQVLISILSGLWWEYRNKYCYCTESEYGAMVEIWEIHHWLKPNPGSGCDLKTTVTLPCCEQQTQPFLFCIALDINCDFFYCVKKKIKYQRIKMWLVTQCETVMFFFFFSHLNAVISRWSKDSARPFVTYWLQPFEKQYKMFKST